MDHKLRSFTLAELLVVMSISAIVVGISFTVLRLVQKQVHTIKVNFDRTSELMLFEQRLWQDFNRYPSVHFNAEKKTLWLQSETDTLTYAFFDEISLRDKDTIKLKLFPKQGFYKGQAVSDGNVDAISLSAEQEFPDYHIFISRKNDATLLMNQDGL